MSAKVYLFSQILKPITTTRLQVTMKRIACTIEAVEMKLCMGIVGWADIMLNKTLETWRGGGFGSTLWSYIIN